MIHAERSPRTDSRLTLLAAAAPVILVGCASTDPGPDRDRAAQLVARHEGGAPAWNEPAGSSPHAWDGVSALTLRAAIASALSNNRDIRASVELIGTARADLVQAGLLPNPVIGLTLRFPFDPSGGPTMVGATAVQEFTSLWLRKHRIRAAESRLNATVLDVSDKALRLVADVRRSHAAILYGQQSLDLTGQGLELSTRTVETVRRLREAGEETDLALNRAAGAHLALEIERSRVERDLSRERRALLELMGVGEAGNADGLVVVPDARPMPGIVDEATAVRLAREQRLDVAAARALAEAGAASLTEAERSRLRVLSAGVDFERDDGQKSIGPMVEAEIPIFDTGAARIARAGSEARAALLTYEAVEQRAIREVRQAFVTFNADAALAAKYRDRVLPLAEDSERVVRAAASAGEAGALLMLSAQKDLVDARRALNESELESELARIDLELAVGGSLVATTTTP